MVMKRAVVYLLVGMVLGAGMATSAQSQLMPFREKYSAQYPPIPVGPFKTPDPFEGKWEIDKEQSTSYPKIENIVIKVTGDVQDYKNDIANEAGPTRHQGYENRFNEMLWVPYMRANVGKPFQYLMTIKGDDRTHYRFIRNLDGTFGGIMLRRLAPDGRSYVSVGFSPDGNVTFKRAFKKVDNFTHTTATEDMTCKPECRNPQ
jgi:hypothetical protein